MNFAVVSIAAGGFLLGGAYSIARLETTEGERGRGKFALAAVLLLLGGYLVVSGMLQLLEG